MGMPFCTHLLHFYLLKYVRDPYNVHTKTISAPFLYRRMGYLMGVSGVFFSGAKVGYKEDAEQIGVCYPHLFPSKSNFCENLISNGKG